MTSTAIDNPADWTHLPSPSSLRFARAMAALPHSWLSVPAAAAAADTDLPSARLRLALLAAAGVVTVRGVRYRIVLAPAAAIEPPPAEAIANLADWYLRSIDAALNELGMSYGYWPTPAPPRRSAPQIEPPRFAEHDAAYTWLIEEEDNLLAVLRAAAAARLDAHTWQLAVHLLQSWSFRGEYTHWEHTARIALDAALAAGDRVGHAQALAYQARGFSQRGLTSRAEQLQLEALEIRELASDRHGLAQSHNALGMIAHRRDDLPSAIAHYRTCETLAEDCDYDIFAALARHNLADALRTQGHLAEAMELLERTIAYYEEHGHPYAVGSTAQILADVLGLQGLTEEALAAANAALARCALLSDNALLAWALRTVCGALARAGRTAEAIEAARAAAVLFDSVRDPQRHAKVLDLAAGLYDGQGETESAAELRAQAGELRAHLSDADDETEEPGT